MENLQAYGMAEVSRQQDYPRKPFITCFQYPLKALPTPNYIFIRIYLIINKPGKAVVGLNIGLPELASKRMQILSYFNFI